MSAARSPDPLAPLLVPLVGLFLFGGLLASTEALLVPRLQLALRLDYARALGVQFFFYAGYLLFAWPATAATLRWGAVAAIRGALALVTLGCAALAEAQHALAFPALVAALACLSAGVTGLQVACNGLAATAGPAATAAARFTLLQAFNALGTVAGPLVAADALLGRQAGRRASALFLALAGLFALTGWAMVRAGSPAALVPAGVAGPAPRLGAVLRRPAVAGGAAAIFAYVGAEVTVASVAVAYLLLPGGGSGGPVAAARLVSLYWGGAMLGRFAGAALLRHRPADRLLVAAAAGALGLTTAAILLRGPAGGAALLALGLCHSIMFPVIYGLAMPSEPREVPLAAMLICMAVAGGAVVPLLTGLIADRLSLRPALALPGACYLVIWRFARAARRRRVA